MPAATTFLILKKDGKEKSWEPHPIVFNGEIHTNHMKRLLFTKIPAGGNIQGERPAPTASLHNFTAFPSDINLSAFGTPGNKPALKSVQQWCDWTQVSRYPSPREPRRSRSAPYPQFSWQGAVCQESQIFLQPAVTCGLNGQHFHTGPWLGRDCKKQKNKRAEIPKFLYKNSLSFR